MPANILIIEDSIVSAMLMEASINRKAPEFAVRIRKSLRGGFEELEAFRPNLIILDLSLPDSPQGEEALAAIPRLRQHAAILAVSGYLEMRAPALAAGADDFMGKGTFGEATGEAHAPLITRVLALLPTQCSSAS